MIEGEGSFLGRQTPRGAWEASIQVSSTDYSTIRRLHQIVGSGRTYICKRKTRKEKRAWTWRLQKKHEVEHYTSRLFWFLGPRRQSKALITLFVTTRPDLRTWRRRGRN